MTGRGKVSVNELEGMEEMVDAFDKIVSENKAHKPDFERQLAMVPRLKTPWYGWGILVAVVVFVGWLFWLAIS